MFSRSAVLSSGASATDDRSLGGTLHAILAQYSAGRTRRVAGILLGIAVVGLLDLHLTVREAKQSYFYEANPVADTVLDGSLLTAGLYKGTLLGAGIAILLTLRRYRSTEIGCWILLAAHVALLLCWGSYYAAASKLDPTIHFDRWGNAWTEPLPNLPRRMADESTDPTSPSEARGDTPITLGSSVHFAPRQPRGRQVLDAQPLDEGGWTASRAGFGTNEDQVPAG